MFESLQDWQDHIDKLEEENQELKRTIKDLLRIYNIPQKYDVYTKDGILTLDNKDTAYKIEKEYWEKEFSGGSGFHGEPIGYINLLERKVYI